MRPVLLCALMSLTACTSARPHASAPDASTLRFSGKVQAVNDGCFADGVCSVTVDDVVVVTLVGWSRETWGTREDGLQAGNVVEVYCRRTPEGCTLNGDAGYHVRRKR